MYGSVHPLPRLVLCVAIAACGGERKDPTPKAQPPAVASVAQKPSAPPPDLEIGDGYEMRHPIHDGRLTLIPIIQTVERPATAYVTLHDAMARHEVTVRELRDWQVDKVRIKNKSDQPLFVMTGELIVDALQDRVLAEDKVILPHSSQTVSVRCVEQNRERGGHEFHPGNALAELDLRELVAHSGQTQVWAQVDAINQRLGLTPPSKTYRLAAQAQPAARRDALIAQLAQTQDRQLMVGLAVAVDGKLVAFDRFASPALYGELERELVGSYVASDGGPPHEGHSLIPSDVRAFASLPAAVSTDASFVVLQPL